VNILRYRSAIPALLSIVLLTSPLPGQPDEPLRCGFLVGAERSRVNKLAEGLQADRERPVLPEWVESADGAFRVHFTRQGIDAVPLYDRNGNGVPDFVETALRALDSARLAANRYGGSIPLPNDGLEGGSPAVDVYLVDLSKAGPSGFGYYGITVPDSLVKDRPKEHFPRYTTWMEVDNDFSPDDRNQQGQPVFATFGEDGLRVTCAHEYHHVVQIGGYGDAGVELMLYELMSSWMEIVTYPELRDWLIYAARTFNRPEAYPLSEPSTFNGYVWGWFPSAFGDVRSVDVISSTLQNIGTGQRPFRAFVGGALTSSMPLDTVFVRTLPAIYATGSRGTFNDVIPHAAELPEIRLAVDESVRAPSAVYSSTIRPFEVRALRYSIPSLDGGPPVSISLLATWPDTSAFINSTVRDQSTITVRLTTPPTPGDVPIDGTAWSVGVQPSSIAWWIDGGTLRVLPAPYPQPVTLSTSSMIYVPVDGSVPGDEARLTLMNVQMLGVHRVTASVEIDGDRLVVPYDVPQSTTPGTYLLQLDHGGRTQLFKILVRR
jgi:hypothetical protein